MITQLRSLGLDENAIKLVEKYFESRSQQVEIGGKRGAKREAPYGVLQGSGMTPLLFLIYFMRGIDSVRRCEEC